MGEYEYGYYPDYDYNRYDMNLGNPKGIRHVMENPQQYSSTKSSETKKNKGYLTKEQQEEKLEEIMKRNNKIRYGVTKAEQTGIDPKYADEIEIGRTGATRGSRLPQQYSKKQSSKKQPSDPPPSGLIESKMNYDNYHNNVSYRNDGSSPDSTSETIYTGYPKYQYTQHEKRDTPKYKKPTETKDDFFLTKRNNNFTDTSKKHNDDTDDTDDTYNSDIEEIPLSRKEWNIYITLEPAMKKKFMNIAKMIKKEFLEKEKTAAENTITATEEVIEQAELVIKDAHNTKNYVENVKKYEKELERDKYIEKVKNAANDIKNAKSVYKSKHDPESYAREFFEKELKKTKNKLNDIIINYNSAIESKESAIKSKETVKEKAKQLIDAKKNLDKIVSEVSNTQVYENVLRNENNKLSKNNTSIKTIYMKDIENLEDEVEKLKKIAETKFKEAENLAKEAEELAKEAETKIKEIEREAKKIKEEIRKINIEQINNVWDNLYEKLNMRNTRKDSNLSKIASMGGKRKTRKQRKQKTRKVRRIHKSGKTIKNTRK